MSDSGTSTVFSQSGSISTFVVPQTGIYFITAAGAEGGSGTPAGDRPEVSLGGLGGVVGADFLLAQGQTLEVAVGAGGENAGASQPVGYDAGGGGGASYVLLVNAGSTVALEVAGGGGGGFAGETTQAFESVSGGAGGAGGSGTGAGGAAGVDGDGGGGAGLLGDGASSGTPITGGGDTTDPATGGSDFVDGLTGGVGAYEMNEFDNGGNGGNGGYGGGGGGGFGTGGGGGGYTGGAAGLGGTSFVAADGVDAFLAAGSAVNGSVTISEPACFLERTRILTPSGPVAVETFRVGDDVLTAGGAARTIRWIRRARIDCDLHDRPEAVWPIRIARHAFGPGRPRRAVLLSPSHAVFVAGVLVPAKHLVNGGSIRQVRQRNANYFHLQLDSHDILLADGLPVESFLPIDAGGVGFDVPGMASLAWEAHAYAPLVVDGPILGAIRAWLTEQAHSQRGLAA